MLFHREAIATNTEVSTWLRISTAGELAPRRVMINPLHPGTLLDTKMVRQGFGRAIGRAEDGAEAEVHLATAPGLAGVTGAYFEGMERAEPQAQANDPEARRRLIALVDALTAQG